MSRSAPLAKRLVGAVLLVATICPAATASAAALHFPQAQEAGLPANATATAGNQYSQLSVSCPSAGNCAGVGYYEGPSTTDPMVVSETNGTWAAASQLTQLPTGANGRAGLNSVSCASAGNCVAVGNAEVTHQVPQSTPVTNTQPMVVTETNGVWGAATAVKPPSGAYTGTNQYANLSSVTCTAVANCVAVGTYDDGSQAEQAMVTVETNGVWGQATQPPTLPLHTGSSLQTVSCSTSGACVAVGEIRQNGVDRAIALSSSSVSGWAVAVPAIISLPTNAATDPTIAASFLNSVSCVAAGSCEAVGEYVVGTASNYDYLAMTVSESGGTWSSAQEFNLLPPGGSGSPLADVLDSISCTAVGDCLAAGGYGYIDSNSEPLVATEANGTWTQATELTPPANAASAANQYSGLDSVSCTGSLGCVVAGRYTDAAGDYLPLLDSSVPLLTITTGGLPYMAYNTPYTAQLAASGGAGADTWALSSGSLPSGLTLNPSTGAISGTPANLNPETFTVTVTDAESPAQTATASFTIKPQPYVLPHFGPIIGGHNVMALLSCPAGSAVSCDGTLTLTAHITLSRHGHYTRRQLARTRKRETLVLGVSTYAIAVGQNARIRIKLDARARRLLKQRGRIVATLTVTPSGAAPAWSRKVILH